MQVYRASCTYHRLAYSDTCTQRPSTSTTLYQQHDRFGYFDYFSDEIEIGKYPISTFRARLHADRIFRTQTSTFSEDMNVFTCTWHHRAAHVHCSMLLRISARESASSHLCCGSTRGMWLICYCSIQYSHAVVASSSQLHSSTLLVCVWCVDGSALVWASLAASYLLHLFINAHRAHALRINTTVNFLSHPSVYNHYISLCNESHSCTCATNTLAKILGHVLTHCQKSTKVFHDQIIRRCEGENQNMSKRCDFHKVIFIAA